MKKLLLIVNPQAGRKEGQTRLFQIVRVFSDEGYEVTVYPTSRRHDCTRKVLDEAGRYDLVVCCGGDGTLNETVSGMMRSGERVPIGYIPLGSTNDLAASLHLPSNVIEAARRCVRGVPFHMDVGSIGGRYFNYIAAFGAFTRASYATPQEIKNALGHFAYILEGIKEVKNIQPIRMKVTADGNTWEDDFLFGSVSNTTSVGGIVKLDPGMVRLDDGLYEVLLVRNPTSASEAQLMLGAVVTQDFSGPFLKMIRARTARFESDRKIPWTLDGEYGGATTDATVLNHQGAVTLMT